MIDPCEDCLINTVCSERCDQRREYTQDVYAELRGQELLYRKNMITEETYKRAEDLFNKVQRENFAIQLRGGIDQGDGSSSSSVSSSSYSYLKPTCKLLQQLKHRLLQHLH